MPDLRLGALCWNQYTDWPSLLAAGRRADELGYDTLWTWDHLYPIVGSSSGPIHEAWLTLAAWAQATERIRIGLMVGANTFREPTLTAKMATTLDHISGGRAILGIGGAWFGREHDGYGIDFGSGFGERLDRLDESVMLIRRLLDGERIADHGGPVYRMHDALVEPRPIQKRLPIMIGGSGPKKTLRTTARYADGWNTDGSVEELRAKDAILRERCDEVGRNSDEIERTTSVWMVIRDDPAEARRVMRANAAANGDTLSDDDLVYVGSPDKIADELRPIVELGFRHVIVDAMAPYDAETLERLADVRERLS